MNFNKNPVAYGFAVAGSNGGHRAAAYPGASFAVDRGLSLSYASGKIYDTDVVAKALLLNYYGKPAKYRYFAGCSNGGKNASVAAGVFGDDYDGIVAGDGVYGHNDDNVGGSDMSGMTAKWAASTQATRAVPISAAKGAAVYQAQLAACDAADGIADGIISNPEACHFNLLSLVCSGNGNDACLTAQEIQTIASLRSDLTDANGRVIGAPWGLGDPSQANASSTGLGGGFLALAFGVSSYDINNFNLNRDFGTLKSVLDGVYGMSGSLPGITSYLKKGKKLIIYHGWDDMTVQPSVLCRLAEVGGWGRRKRTAIYVSRDATLPRRCRSGHSGSRRGNGQLGRGRGTAERHPRRGEAFIVGRGLVDSSTLRLPEGTDVRRRRRQSCEQSCLRELEFGAGGSSRPVAPIIA